MRSAAQPKKLEAQIIELNRYVFTICPHSFVESDLDAKKGEKLQRELTEHLGKCGLRAGIDFTFAQPNSIEMIKFEGRQSLLAQYFVKFHSPGAVLNALKVVPAHFYLRTTHEINFEELRTTYALQHSDNELIMPADFAEIIYLHKRSYVELFAKVQAAIQSSAGNMYPALVNFQAAMKYIDENIKDDPYLVEASRYSLLVLALWYVVQELADIKPEVEKGFMATFRKVSANKSPINTKYQELLSEYAKRIPNKFNDSTITSAATLKELYNEKIGKHIKPVLTPAKK